MTLSTNGKAAKTKSTFRMEVAVSITINAKPEKIWALLTNAKDFPRWNSMVESIDGTISLGETIKLKAPYAPGRTFKLKVSQMAANKAMRWQDGGPMFQGIRNFTLAPKSNGTTDFTMVETYSGMMLPMIAGSLPDLVPSFEQYAADLKKEAEKTGSN
jgi:hypothetical protein